MKIKITDELMNELIEQGIYSSREDFAREMGNIFKIGTLEEVTEQQDKMIQFKIKYNTGSKHER